MSPAPADFHNAARMDALSLYGLYNTIALGVSGTPMRAFSELSEPDRWALAFYVGNLRSSPDVVARGRALWKQGQGRAQLGSLRALVTSPIAQMPGGGGVSLAAVQTYLTAHPESIGTSGPAPLEMTRQKLDEALEPTAQAITSAPGNWPPPATWRASSSSRPVSTMSMRRCAWKRSGR